MNISKLAAIGLLVNVGNVFAGPYYWYHHHPYNPYPEVVLNEPIVEYTPISYDQIDHLRAEIRDLRVEKKLHPLRSEEIDRMIFERQERIKALENDY